MGGQYLNCRTVHAQQLCYQPSYTVHTPLDPVRASPQMNFFGFGMSPPVEEIHQRIHNIVRDNGGVCNEAKTNMMTFMSRVLKRYSENETVLGELTQVLVNYKEPDTELALAAMGRLVLDKEEFKPLQRVVLNGLTALGNRPSEMTRNLTKALKAEQEKTDDYADIFDFTKPISGNAGSSSYKGQAAPKGPHWTQIQWGEDIGGSDARHTTRKEKRREVPEWEEEIAEFGTRQTTKERKTARNPWDQFSPFDERQSQTKEKELDQPDWEDYSFPSNKTRVKPGAGSSQSSFMQTVQSKNKFTRLDEDGDEFADGEGYSDSQDDFLQGPNTFTMTRRRDDSQEMVSKTDFKRALDNIAQTVAVKVQEKVMPILVENAKEAARAAVQGEVQKQFTKMSDQTNARFDMLAELIKSQKTEASVPPPKTPPALEFIKDPKDYNIGEMIAHHGTRPQKELFIQYDKEKTQGNAALLRKAIVTTQQRHIVAIRHAQTDAKAGLVFSFLKRTEGFELPTPPDTKTEKDPSEGEKGMDAPRTRGISFSLADLREGTGDAKDTGATDEAVGFD